MKNAKIKVEHQLEFFNAVNTLPLEELRAYCINLIENSRVPNHTMKNQMKTASRNKIIDKMNNFIMKGHGYGV